ncbi:hypothetical protein H5410_010535 [Solanum commersonii]|uniref:Uncharacterized protein n=1 Tax=Solanum commersonii TaxID=4109 RepID=A0A9J6AL08_SOLCO|nr:hypothetical protein H5410_010535 [Solanum commersonii]
MRRLSLVLSSQVLDMDLETENRIATILLKEAAELRRQAQSEGALSYLHRPNVRGRPNSRFLTATVLGVQQGLLGSFVNARQAKDLENIRGGSGIQFQLAFANRAVEVNEMWNLRQKEVELENRIKGRSAEKNSDTECHNFSVLERRSRERYDTDSGTRGSKKRRIQDSHSSEDEGLRDAEIEEFLHSRVKRGRGTVGSRMDEAGPYLPSSSDPREKESASPEMKLSKGSGYHVVVGPEKPIWLNSPGSSENESLSDDKRKAPKKAKSSKHRDHCRKHRSKKKSKDKEDKRREERRKDSNVKDR